MMTDRLEHEVFTKHLNSKFRIQASDSVAIETELTEVTEHLLSPSQERFAVVFRGPGDSILLQGIRRLEHEVMGSFELFLVPIRRDEEGTYYEAVFNRLRKQD